MTNNTLPESDSLNYKMLVPPISDNEKRAKKDLVNRLGTYANWLDENRRTYMKPALDDYRDYLLEARRLAPTTVNAHLATIRSRFRSLLKSGAIQAAVRASQHEDDDEKTRAKEVNNIVERIRREIAVNSTRVEVPPSDTIYLRLTKEDVLQLRKGFDELLKDFDGSLKRFYEFLKDQREFLGFVGEFSRSVEEITLVRIRDRAIFGLMYTTGLRENEVCALEVNDLYRLFDGEPALHVPEGRGCVERLIPYGGLIWGLKYVNTWLFVAQITDGPVFRGFYKGGGVRPSGLSVRALEYTLESYPVTIEGEEIKIRPMDLRRAYARLLYETGMSLGAIRENLGVQDINTVLDYIGPVPPDTRIPAPIENSDLNF
jgi:integrase